MFKRRIILWILCTIALLSGATFFLLLKYFDPYIHPTIAVLMLAMSFVFSLTSFCAVIFYFFKKIYYRGEVGIYHVLSSVRQWFWVSVFCICATALYAFHIPYVLPLILIGVIFLLLEFLIQG